MADVEFVPINAGFIELAKDPAIAEVLKEKADEMAEAANRSAAEHLKADMGIDELEVEPYGSAVDELDRTNVGVAFVRTELGGINEARHKSLMSQNH